MINGLNIITWNARGIRNKCQELFQFLIRHNVHVCLVSETWLKHNVSIRHNEFYTYRNDRENARGGGVAIMVRKNISHILLPIVNTNLIENIGIKLFTNNGSYNIYSCYFPGGSAGSDNNRKRLFALDVRKLTINRGQKYILGGDFNSRHQMWGCIRANCWGNILHEKLESYEIDIMYPNDHTYVPSSSNRQGSTLDFFFNEHSCNDITSNCCK